MTTSDLPPLTQEEIDAELPRIDEMIDAAGGRNTLESVQAQEDLARAIHASEMAR